VKQESRAVTRELALLAQQSNNILDDPLDMVLEQLKVPLWVAS